MNTQTDNPSLDSLRTELLSEFAGTTTPAVPATTEGGGGESAEGEAEGSTSTPEKKDNPTDHKAKETPKPKIESADAKAEGEGEATSEVKPGETDYSKAKKDKERFRANWNELEKGKTELKAQQGELEKQRQEIAADRQRIEQDRLKSASDTRKASKYTPEQLERYAKEFEAEGKPELAAQALAKAKELRDAVGVEQQQKTQQQKQVYQTQSVEHWNRAVKDFPEMGNPESPARKRAEKVYGELHAELAKSGMVPAPSTRYLVAQHADALMRAETATSKVEGLEKRVTELETENKRLTKKSALPGGAPPPADRPAKDFNSLSLKQQRDSLKADFAS